MSKIEWTGETWNPISGCSRKSTGCENCYAETLTKRLGLMGNPKYQGLLNEQNRFNGVIKFDENALLIPLKKRKPTTYFVNSMSDLFHENCNDEWIDKVFAVMGLAKNKGQIFQILTKRADRMLKYFSTPKRELIERWSNVSYDFGLTFRNDEEDADAVPCHVFNIAEEFFPLPNVWLGVSVENQKAADERIPLLLETPAAIRWLSCEPLLEQVNIERWLLINWQCSGCRGYFSGGWKMTCPDCGRKEYWCGSHKFNGRKVESHPNFPAQDGIGIDWVVVGGESGNGARDCEVHWIRKLVKQCQSAKVPVFVKQLGSKPYVRDLIVSGYLPISNKKGGNIEEFPTDLQIREYPK